ncbi:hypothetical protein EDB83DRAFT_2522516 [Lactarius deliciosus]|nr:hypothetical protein EDB83DRAFT_2522516 [Lactarius deliciosus]
MVYTPGLRQNIWSLASGKIWAQVCVLGSMLVADESACVELESLREESCTSRSVPPPLQISNTFANIAFRYPEYTAIPGTKAHPRHGNDVGEDEDKVVGAKKKTLSLFEVREVVSLRISTSLGSKDIALELPVAIFHPATLPPPPPEPYLYPIPDAYLDPYLTPPHLPNADALRGTRVVSALRLSHDPSSRSTITISSSASTLSRHIDHTMDSSGSYLLLPHISADPPTDSCRQIGQQVPTQPPYWLRSPVWIAHFRHTRSRARFHLITNNSNSNLLAAAVDQSRYTCRRISYHLRTISCTRSVLPPPAPSQSPPPPPTQVEVEVLAPKPVPSPKLVSEMLDVDPFAQSFGRVGTRARSLSAVKLKEMAARAAAETEAKAAADKTLPAPPVPFGKPPGRSELRRPSAKDVFGKKQVSAEPETVPHAVPLHAVAPVTPAVPWALLQLVSSTSFYSQNCHQVRQALRDHHHE